MCHTVAQKTLLFTQSVGILSHYLQLRFFKQFFFYLQVNEKQKQAKNKKFIETQSDSQAFFFFFFKSEAEHYPTSNDLEIRKSGYLKNFLCLAFELILL